MIMPPTRATAAARKTNNGHNVDVCVLGSVTAIRLSVKIWAVDRPLALSAAGSVDLKRFLIYSARHVKS
jgi:hypothetical protein